MYSRLSLVAKQTRLYGANIIRIIKTFDAFPSSPLVIVKTERLTVC